MDNVVLIFTDSRLSKQSYTGLITALQEKGFIVEVNTLNNKYEKLHIISHGDADKRAIQFIKDSDINVDKLIIASPIHSIGSSLSDDTLILWGDDDKKYNHHLAIKNIYSYIKSHPEIGIIGYPNVSFFLFAGIYYSQHHDEMDLGNEYICEEVYNHIDEVILNDIVDFLLGKPLKIKIAISNENYFPFVNGVNVLCNVLKNELFKLGYNPYIVTFKLKGYNYITPYQERNIVLVKGFPIIGGKKDDVYFTPFIKSCASQLEAYGFDVIHLQNEFTLAKVLVRIKKKEKLPMIFTQHTMWDDMFYKRYGRPIARFLTDFLHKFFFSVPIKNYNIMVVPTLKVEKYWEGRNVKDNVFVLPGCVNEDNFNYVAEDDEKINNIKNKYNLNNKIVMGYLGRISKEKSITELLEYFNRIAPEIPNLVFMIVGDGPFLEELTRITLASPYKERIIIVGAVDNRQVKNYFRCFTFFSTASTFETQGLTYLESMLSNTVVLAKKDPCIKKFLTNNVNSFVFTDFKSFKKSLILITTDKEKVNKIKENALATAHEYSKVTWAKRYINLYQQAKKIVDGEISFFNSDEVNNIR